MIAWIMQFGHLLDSSEAEEQRLHIKGILKRLLPNRQSRFYKGASMLIYMHSLVRIK